MSLETRLDLYSMIEAERKRPLVVYATSSRPNASGNMAADVIPQLLDQLNLIPKNIDSVDLLVVSQGGDPSVAWRTICLLRERFQKVGVLVPSSAFSAATLLCLGADEIVMHHYGNLGPVDPQVTVRKKINNESTEIKFGFEEVVSFIQFVRDRAHITDQAALTTIIGKMLDDTGTVSIGVAVRGSMQSLTLGENLLRMHMRGEGEASKAKDIAEILNKKFYNHGHALGRAEAKSIGLKVTDCGDGLAANMWSVWEALETEMKMREAFNPMTELMNSATSAPLFAPLTSISMPQGLPPAMMQMVFQQLASQLQIPMNAIPPVDCTLTFAVVESTRLCSRFAVRRKIFGSRQPDANIQIVMAECQQGWEKVEIPENWVNPPVTLQLSEGLDEDTLPINAPSNSAVESSPPVAPVRRNQRASRKASK